MRNTCVPVCCVVYVGVQLCGKLVRPDYWGAGAGAYCNSSRQPSLKPRVLAARSTLTSPVVPVLVFVAARLLPVGTELTHDYKTTWQGTPLEMSAPDAKALASLRAAMPQLPAEQFGDFGGYLAALQAYDEAEAARAAAQAQWNHAKSELRKARQALAEAEGSGIEEGEDS